MSFSAADTRWSDFIRESGMLNNQRDAYLYAKIETMTLAENSRLMQKNPDTCIKYFDHRLK